MADVVRLLLVDVDGTLVTQEKILTPRAIAAVKDLKRAGIAMAITSGRPPRGMAMLVEPLALETPMAGFNGGVFANPDLTVIESHTLDPAAAKEAVDLVEKAGLDAWLYTPEVWFVRDKAAPHVAREAWTVKFEAEVTAKFSEAALSQAVKIVGVSDDKAKVAAAEKAAQERLGARANAARSQPYYLDITHPQANKGQVVAWLSRKLHVPPAEIATIGDMPNDVTMFVASGYSIAMGQSDDEVKAKAAATTDSNEEEGFAKAVARLIAERAPSGGA